MRDVDGEVAHSVVSARELGVEYFLKAISTGEASAAQRLESHLASDVEFDTNSQPGVPPIAREVFRGKDVVLSRVSGQWPSTSGYGRLGWSEPFAEGDGLKVISSGAVTVTFEFNAADEIRRAYLDGGWGSGVAPPPVVDGAVEEIPLVIKGLINSARARDKPLSVTYVDAQGVPRSSYRGSTCVVGATQLAIWVRDANGGLLTAVQTNPLLSLVYSDFGGGVIINITGRGHPTADEEMRRKVYETTIESEQNHDTERRGVALLIDVIRLEAFAAGKGFSITRE